MMVRYFLHVLFVYSFLSFFSCSKKEEPEPVYPRLRTLPVEEISTEGAVFTGEVVFPGSQEILEQGFVWEEQTLPTLEKAERKVVVERVSEGKFSSMVNYSLKENVTYLLRAYARTPDFTVYGQLQSFKSLGSKPAEITAIEPSSGIWGDTIAIKGKGFSYQKIHNLVHFGNVLARNLIGGSDSLWLVQVPFEENHDEVRISIQVQGEKAFGPVSFQYLEPELDGFFPKKGTALDTVTITGKNLSPSLTTLVWFDQYKSPVISRTKNEIKVLVPEKLKEEKSTIYVEASGKRKFFTEPFVLLP